jgi:hypothetical protein
MITSSVQRVGPLSAYQGVLRRFMTSSRWKLQFEGSPHLKYVLDYQVIHSIAKPKQPEDARLNETNTPSTHNLSKRKTRTDSVGSSHYLCTIEWSSPISAPPSRKFKVPLSPQASHDRYRPESRRLQSQYNRLLSLCANTRVPAPCGRTSNRTPNTWLGAFEGTSANNVL